MIGLTTAWYLAGEGAKVTVVDRVEVGRQASWAGAGILPPAELASAASPIDRLRAHSLRLYADLSRQLLELTGIDNGYRVCGGVELPDPESPGAALPTDEWHAPGVTSERLGPDGLRRCVPDLALSFDHGVLLPTLAQVRNPWHLRALAAGCLARGARLLPEWPAERLRTRGQFVEGVEGPHGQLSAGRVLLAAGAWSAKLIAQAGVDLPVFPVRGQMVLFPPGRPGVRPVLLQGKRYLVPRTDGRLLAGSTEEHAGFDATPTEEGVAGLVAFARRLMPALGDVEPEKTWAGLRPSNPDGLPYLGQVPGWDNLFVGAGHFRAGLQLSPASGLLLCQALLGRTPLLPLEPFAPGRPVTGAPGAARSNT